MHFERVKIYMPLILITSYYNLDLPCPAQGRKGRTGECLVLTISGSSINV